MLTLDDINTIRDLIAQGKSASVIAPQFDVSKGTILRFAHKHDLGPWRSHIAAAPKQRAVPSDFRANARTMSISAMSRKWHCDPNTAKRWLEECGIKPPNLTGKPIVFPDNFEQIVQENTMDEASEILGIGRDAIRAEIRKQGIVRNRIPAHTIAADARRKAKLRALAMVKVHKPMGAPGAPIVNYQRDMSPSGLAADILQRDRWTVFRCDVRGTPMLDGFFWRCGSVICTDTELMERAERAARRMGEPIPWLVAA